MYLLKLQPSCPVATAPLGAVAQLIYCPGSAADCTIAKCSHHNHGELVLWFRGAAKPPGPTGTHQNRRGVPGTHHLQAKPSASWNKRDCQKVARANQPNRPPNSSPRFYQTTPIHTPPPPPTTITITITTTIVVMGLGDLHHTTPVKARILGTVSYLQHYKIPFFKSDVFRHNQVSKPRGWKILYDGENHKRRHPKVETRGRKPILQPANLQAIKQIIWRYGFQARRLTWQGLALTASISGISERIITRSIGQSTFFLRVFTPYPNLLFRYFQLP